MSNQKSLIEVALEVMERQANPIDIYELIEKVLEEKDLVDSDGTYAAKLYVEIVKSSKFVIFKDEADQKDKIDLKSRQPLELFDQDGSSFNDKEDKPKTRKAKAVVDDDEDLDLDDENDEEDEDLYDDSYNDEDEDEDENNEYIEDEENEEDSYDDDDDSYDEDKYNEYMDDYEDMYED